MPKPKKSVDEFKPQIFQPTFISKDAAGNPCHIYQADDGEELISTTTAIKNSLGLYKYKWTGSNYAADRGTAVHQACQFYDEKDLNESTLDPVVKPYLEQYKLALSHHGIIVEANELMRYDNDLRFAGSIDKIIRCLPKINRRAIVDIKTGKVENWHPIQTGSYGIMLQRELGDLDRYCLYLKPYSFHLVQHTNPMDKTHFRLLLAETRIPEKDSYSEEETAILVASNNLKRNLGYLGNIRIIK